MLSTLGLYTGSLEAELTYLCRRNRRWLGRKVATLLDFRALSKKERSPLKPQPPFPRARLPVVMVAQLMTWSKNVGLVEGNVSPSATIPRNCKEEKEARRSVLGL